MITKIYLYLITKLLSNLKKCFLLLKEIFLVILMDEDILNALCGNAKNQSTSFAPKISTKDQYDFLVKNINFLNKATKKKICKIPINAGHESKVGSCNEGLAILMDLPDNVIEDMYNLCYFELKRI
jgi:hypothetical protein